MAKKSKLSNEMLLKIQSIHRKSADQKTEATQLLIQKKRIEQREAELYEEIVATNAEFREVNNEIFGKFGNNAQVSLETGDVVIPEENAKQD